MRRLGSMLGVEAMSLYRYVPGRENLLDAVVDSILSEMEADPEIHRSPQDGWQDFLIRLAHGVRRVALAHPKAFPLVASRPVEAPWLRPPLRSMVWVEAFLDGLIGEGFSDDAAAGAYRAFTSFLLGHLLLEVSALGGDVGPLDVVDDGEDRNERTTTYPTVERLRGALSQDHSAIEFEESLESLVNRIALIQSES
jgi:AcrR family transcriptional regulator